MTSWILLAFGFTTPLLLWGLLFAAAPVLIHLLLKRKYRVTRWAAMQFLIAATQKQSRWSRLDHWLLLAVRTMIPLLIAFALAGPVMELALGAANRAPTHRILVLDSSLSLQAREAGKSRAALVRAVALELTESAEPGDTWQVLLLDRVPRAVIPEPTFLIEPVLEEIRNWEPGASTADPLAALELVQQWVQSTGDQQPEVHLLTDAQRTTWRLESATQRQRLQDLLTSISQRAKIQWSDVSSQAVSNLAITDVQTSAPYALVGQPLRLKATIQRFGDEVAPRTLTWRVDGRQIAAQPVEFSGPNAELNLNYTPSTSGDLRIEASLSPDELTLDDRRDTVVVVRDALRVLLVDGRPSGQAFENATDCLRLALSPQSLDGPPSQIAVTVIPDGQFLVTPLESFDVVFLCDVPLLTEREAELISRYVSSGGSLVIGMGPKVQAESYNQTLLNEARPLLPARLGDLMGDPQRRETSYAFRSQEFTHPILQPFRGNPNTGFELTQTFAYLKSFPQPDAQIAVEYETGDPAMIEHPYGLGRVMLVTTALDRSWGTWPVWGHTFVPMMHETLRYLLSGQFQSRHVLVGQPLTVRLPRAGSGSSFQIRTPNEDQRTLVTSPSVTPGTATFEDTRQPGFYGIETSGSTGPVTWFAVQTDPRESDLTPLSATELREGIFAGRNPAAHSPTPSDQASTVRAASRSSDPQLLPRWLIGLALILLIGEPFLAWNRPVGLAVLLCLGLTTLGGLLFGSWGALSLAVATGAVLGMMLWRLSDRPASME